MELKYEFSFSENILELFQRQRYEDFIVEIMNLSDKVFPETYTHITEQGNGECDFKGDKSGKKFDAKIPFSKEQMKMLTTGEKHKPDIIKWLRELQNEAAEFNPIELRDGRLKIENTKLYQIMASQIRKDKVDENIIFFLPYPMILSVRDSIFSQLSGNYFNSIYSTLVKNDEIGEREIFVIYPASEKNVYALKNMKNYVVEFVQYDKLEKYYSCEIIEVS